MMEEGTIKYRALRRDGTIPEHPDFDALNRCRTKLFDLRLVGVYPSGIGYGNVSLRAGDSSFIISGSATGSIRILGPEHYAWVESFDLKSNSVRSGGCLDASSESMSHGAVYRARPDVNAVIHIHSRMLFDFMRAQHYPETDAAISFGTPEMARAIGGLIASLGADHGVFVMAGHDEGIISYGESVAVALDLISALVAQGERT